MCHIIGSDSLSHDGGLKVILAIGLEVPAVQTLKA